MSSNGGALPPGPLPGAILGAMRRFINYMWRRGGRHSHNGIFVSLSALRTNCVTPRTLQEKVYLSKILRFSLSPSERLQFLSPFLMSPTPSYGKSNENSNVDTLKCHINRGPNKQGIGKNSEI